MEKQWRFKEFDRDIADHLKSNCGVSNITANILATRGIEDRVRRDEGERLLLRPQGRCALWDLRVGTGDSVPIGVARLDGLV